MRGIKSSSAPKMSTRDNTVGVRRIPTERRLPGAEELAQDPHRSRDGPLKTQEPWLREKPGRRVPEKRSEAPDRRARRGWRTSARRKPEAFNPIKEEPSFYGGTASQALADWQESPMRHNKKKAQAAQAVLACAPELPATSPRKPTEELPTS